MVLTVTTSLLLYFLIDILAKEFGQEDNNGQDSMTWQNREKDWYNAERRFIFAAPNLRQRDKWIDLIMCTNVPSEAQKKKMKKTGSVN